MEYIVVVETFYDTNSITYNVIIETPGMLTIGKRKFAQKESYDFNNATYAASHDWILLYNSNDFSRT